MTLYGRYFEDQPGWFESFFLVSLGDGEMSQQLFLGYSGLLKQNLLHSPGRACLIGGALVELSAVRVMSSEMVHCRVPVWQQVRVGTGLTEGLRSGWSVWSGSFFWCLRDVCFFDDICFNSVHKNQ